MQDSHIVKMLEAKTVSSFSADEIKLIETHTADCAACSQAYKAARVSESLIRARAAETIAPSPFFKTRVMAAIRERQLSPELPAIVRMWRAAGALVSAMAMVVAVLIGMTFYNSAPDSQLQSPELLASQSMYSLEYMEFEQTDLAEDGVAYDQVIGTIYDSEDGDGQ